MRATSMPNERDELPGWTRCEKTGAPSARRVLDGSDVKVRHRTPVVGQGAQLVEVRRKEYHRRLFLEREQKLADRLCDRQAVERPGSASDLVDEQQRPLRAAAQDVRRFGHLQIERRLTRSEIVAGADAREDAVDDSEFHGFRRNERADLRHDRQQSGLAQVRRLTAHVRSGQKNEALFAGAQVQVVGDEVRVQHRLHNGMAAILDVDRAFGDEGRAHVASLRGALR